MPAADATQLLGGRVVVLRLPELTPPLGPEAPVLKRLRLAQGELAQVCEGTEGMRYIAPIEIKPGCARGNHYHKAKQEYVYVITGELLVAVQDISTSAVAQILLTPGSLARIEPLTGHVLVARTAGWALEFSPQKFDPTDVFPFPIEQGLSV